MKKYLYIVLFALPLLLTGCTSFKEVRLVKILDVRYEELGGSTLKLAVDVRVDNPNYFNVKITNANMTLRLHERVLGNVTQVEQIELLGRTEADYTVRFSIELRDVMSNMMTLYRLFMNPKELNLSGTVRVRSFIYSRTFQVDRLTFQ